ncbi:MAG: hypothetical protein RMK29_09765 [Myxococcales bacterium]|nr:hypothetical protein [Myxococcota bacterium]MDW8281988.1 hypothetical protein [Myxococcales bacterium]
MMIGSRGISLSLVSVLGALLLGPARAEAHLFEFYVDGYGGGLYGTPQIAGFPQPKPDTVEDFFHDQSGGLLGARLGLELLHTDLYLQFDQFFNRMGAAGSALQLMLGWDMCLGKRSNKGLCGLLGAYGGLVFGFPYTPHPPIDRSQIATFGVAAEGQGGLEYHVNRFLVLQALGTVGYHFLFRTLQGDGIVVANDGSVSFPTSHGFHLMAKVGIRFHLSVL